MSTENEPELPKESNDELIADAPGVNPDAQVFEEELAEEEKFLDFDEEDFDDEFDDDFEEAIEGEYELPQDIFNEDFDGGALADFERKQKEKEAKAKEAEEDDKK